MRRAPIAASLVVARARGALVLVVLPVLLALVAGERARAAVTGTVAVMPFKNLNQDPELDWLKVGIAETMISDLKKGSVAVVERAQIDRALAEMALQGAVGADASTAARLGKLVGANTVVVGGFQRAGKQIRITARFVQVETGVVRDTAKVTGALARIFQLQDEIVTRLLGKKPAPRKRRAVASSTTKRPASGAKGREATPPDAPKPAPTEQDTLDAYRLYSLSLLTSSEAERVQFLREAVELDPDFEYAIRDLEALQRRLEDYEQRSDRLRQEQQTRGLAALDDDKVPAAQRSILALQLLQSHVTSFRYRELLEVAERVYRMDLPPAYGTTDVREYASYYVVLSHQMLKQKDLMLQAGERHLKEFPAGTFFGSVSMLLQSEIQQRRMHQSGADKTRAALEEIEAERQEILGDERTKPYRELRLRALDLRRCTAGSSHQEYETVVDECRRYLERWGDAAGENEQTMAASARYSLIIAYAELGRFDEARALAKAWLDDDAETASRHAIPMLLSTWPR